MKAMKAITDIWNVIDKYNIEGWKQEGRTVYIPIEEFERVYEEMINKRYLLNLVELS